VEEYSRAMQVYAGVLNNIAKSGRDNAERGTIGSSELQRRYAEFVISQGPKVLAQLSQAGINYYTTLADLSMQTLNGYVEHVLQTDESPSGVDGTKSAPLLFHGVRGQAASNAFLISNNRDEAIDVEFDIAEVVSEDGKERLKPETNFTPKKCRLAPCSERIVQCSINLSDPFKAGQCYVGSIAVIGFPEMAMRFEVQVEAPAKTHAPKSTAKKSGPKKAVPKAKKKATPKKAAGKAKKKATRK
jgi:hypothetical protein